ncbi:MAG: MFS transporter [Halioglobus sp.]|nr:MFS transporter [Halioglobus sp.]MCB1707883.1 MFS transporter [Halioglobus sp.]MCP5122100.1 MFS transporter [Pseudomonadales bacterium]MCP5192354.1 MFS transporter [Pseudomonadales bacterium]
MSNLKTWNVEDEAFWNNTGKGVATRNLWISIPCLLAGFGVWMQWGVLTVQMLNLGFPFERSELFTLTAIAGLTGATLRIPSSFFIRLCGGRNTIAFTTALLILPCIGAGIALQDINTPLWVFQLLALLSGFGGGNFASSMSNINFFFPKRMQGYALGMNAGLGNFGVTTMQIVVPLVMTASIFGALGGESMTLLAMSGTLIGKIPAGAQTWIQNAGFIWLLTLVPLSLLAWFGMNNISTAEVTPKQPGALASFGVMSGMLLIGFITAIFGLWLLLPEKANGSGFGVPKEIVLLVVIAATVYLLKLLPGQIRGNLQRQYKIFGNRHTWVMSIIYTMTFGSFIGFSAAFPLAIKVIFGYSHVLGADGVMTHDTANNNGPSALMYAWMGAFIGALIRPVGGWIADKVGGALVTQVITVVMVASSLGVAYYMKAAYSSATPEEYFVPFFLLFLVLFAATGIGNGSTFRTISQVFNKEQAGPVLGWTSAVAAYGAFYIPEMLGEQIKAATPEIALYGFASFYAVCLVINWWYYLRKNAEFHNP